MKPKLVILGLLVPVLALGGCLENDRFARDAVQYNKEAELAQDRVILLNVLRASYRRPFEFSGVQTISGSASTQGQLGFSIPLAQNGGATASTVSPQITRSAGPTVTVGVVDTQEFYEGLLKPLDRKLIDYYVQRGIPEGLLFDLFFQRIIIAQKGKIVATFSNTVSKKNEFDAFQALISYLVNDRKMSTESVDKATAYGPVLEARDVLQQPSYAAKAATAGLDVKQVSWCDLTQSEQDGELQRYHARLSKAERKSVAALCKQLSDAKPAESDKEKDAVNSLQAQLDDLLAGLHIPVTFYRAQKSSTDYGLCFQVADKGDAQSLCKSAKPPSVNADEALALTLSPSETTEPKKRVVTITESPVCQKVRALAPLGAMQTGAINCQQPLELSFAVRSTYQIIYYLGEIVRQELRPDPWALPARPTTTFVDADNSGIPIFELKDVTDEDDDGGFLEVRYDGRRYAAVEGQGHETETAEVLDIVAELTALNKSAKDLPTSSVITAVGLP